MWYLAIAVTTDGRAVVHRRGGQDAHRLQRVGVAGDAAGGFLHALEFADRHAELPADAGIAAERAIRRLSGCGRQRRQRDAAPCREALDQHAPALPGLVRPADDPLHRDEHVLAEDRAVVERGARIVTPADLDTGMRRRDQRAGDAVIHLLLVAEQPLGILQLEGQAHAGRDRRQRDVALLEVQADAQRLLALVLAVADDAEVGHGGGVGSDLRPGQAEAGDVGAVDQARQPEFLLLLGPVVHQELAGPQGVGHHHRHRQGDRLGCELGDDRRLRVGREAQAAELFLHQHGEEFLLLDVGPDLGRQILVLELDFPVVDQLAQLLALVVEEALLLLGQPRVAEVQQLAPVRTAAEHLAFPPDVARLQRLALGRGHLRQHLLEAGEDEVADQGPAQRHHAEHGEDREHDRARDRGAVADQAREAQAGRGNAGDDRPDQQGCADEGQDPDDHERSDEQQCDGHGKLLRTLGIHLAPLRRSGTTEAWVSAPSRSRGIRLRIRNRKYCVNSGPAGSASGLSRRMRTVPMKVE